MSHFLFQFPGCLVWYFLLPASLFLISRVGVAVAMAMTAPRSRRWPDLPRVVGVTGLKHNGKDTVADHLCETYGYSRVAFAGPLKEVCATLFGFSHEQLHGSLKETPDVGWFGVTPRRVLQYIGTDLFRNHMSGLHPEFRDEFWLQCAERRIRKLLEDPEARVVVSDVRFPNECELIKRLGGIVIRVVRPSVNTTADLHDAERLIPTLAVNREVRNEGTIAELWDTVDKALVPTATFYPRRECGESLEEHSARAIRTWGPKTELDR